MSKLSDGEAAIDMIFRLARGVEESLKKGGDYAHTAAAIMVYKQTLREKGWRWHPAEAKTVVKLKRVSEFENMGRMLDKCRICGGGFVQWDESGATDTCIECVKGGYPIPT